MDARQAYSEDPRIPCQYGRKCYQKNPVHHKKYKHPPDPKRKNQYMSTNDSPKRRKMIDNNTDPATKMNDPNDENLENIARVSPEPNIESASNVKKDFSNDISDSESDNEMIQHKTEENPAQDINNSNSASDILNDAKIMNSIICNHQSGHNNKESKDFIKSKFLFDMPEDFYKFFEFCERLKPDDPSKALERIGLRLVGPFDVLCGKFCGVEKRNEDYLIHWRYYFDPPNLQTILKGDDKTGYHIGYFRDNPNEKPVFLTENCGLKDGILNPIGENIFGAVNSYIEDSTCNPFSKMTYKKVQNMIREEAEKLGFTLSRKSGDMTKRNNKVLSRTFNKVGLVVPYERKTQLGYRKLAMSDKALEALLTKIHKAESEEKAKFLAELQSEILTWTDIACDECDFGTGIELGWDILCHGVDLNHTTARLLASNYRQLKWEPFAKIAEAHMANRKKSCYLSIL